GLRRKPRRGEHRLQLAGAVEADVAALEGAQAEVEDPGREAVRAAVADRHPAAGGQDPRHLANRPPWSRIVMKRRRAENGAEGAVGEGKALAVGLLEGGV